MVNKLKDGCILLARVIEQSAIWRDDPHLLKLFIHLILKARHNKKPKRYPGFEVKRGELITSLNDIAEANEWLEHNVVRRWSKQKVSRMLAKLQKQGRVSLIADTYGTHVKVCNYEAYQNLEAYKTDRSGQKWNSSGTVPAINKNDKNGNNDKKKSPLFQIFDHWNIYKSRSITKSRDGEKIRITWHSHRLSPDGSIPLDVEEAIKQSLTKFSVEQICCAIDNYAKVLLGKDYVWSYTWTLAEFLTRGEESHKQAPRKYYRFLPDNFIEERLLTNAARGRRAERDQGPSVYEITKARTEKQKEVTNEQQQTA